MIAELSKAIADRNVEITELRTEIERLQGHMRALADTSVTRDTAGIFKGLWQGSERECEALRAEVERLRRTNAELLTVLKSIERTANQAATMHRAEEPKP